MTLVADSMMAHDSPGPDCALLERYAQQRDESAFRTVAQRHVDWIYAAALRITRDASLAEDVTQGVLLALSRKAAAVARSGRLAGWLFRATRYGAITLMRSERRRKEREHVHAESTSSPVQPSQHLEWLDVKDRLDAAVAALSVADRELILLRFFQRLSHSAMADVLDTTEEAVRKRLGRALLRLRARLHLEDAPEALVAALSAAPLIAAPPFLVSNVLAAKAGANALLVTKGLCVMSTALKIQIAAAAAVVVVATGYVVSTQVRGQAAPPTVAAAGGAETTAPGEALLAQAGGGGGGGGGGSGGPGGGFSGGFGGGGAVGFGGGGAGGGAGGGGFGGPIVGGGGGAGAAWGAGAAGGGVNYSTTTDGTTTTRRYNDGQHDITMTITGGQTTLLAKDNTGNIVYQGPYNTDADRAKVPPDVVAAVNNLNNAAGRAVAFRGPILFSPASRLNDIKQQLGVTDQQWTDLQAKVQAVLTLQAYLDPTRDAAAPPVALPGQNADNPLAPIARDLKQAAADDKTTSDDIDAKITALRDARKLVQTQLTDAQATLAKAVTPRQKAILIGLGVLD